MEENAETADIRFRSMSHCSHKMAARVFVSELISGLFWYFMAALFRTRGVLLSTSFQISTTVPIACNTPKQTFNKLPTPANNKCPNTRLEGLGPIITETDFQRTFVAPQMNKEWFFGVECQSQIWEVKSSHYFEVRNSGVNQGLLVPVGAIVCFLLVEFYATRASTKRRPKFGKWNLHLCSTQKPTEVKCVNSAELLCSEETGGHVSTKRWRNEWEGNPFMSATCITHFFLLTILMIEGFYM